jgi:uncharacterized protein YndB with AHSA1/START domain
MTSRSFATSFSVDQTPEEVFKAITNVRGWWTGDVEGGTDKLGDEFTYRYQDIHCSTQKITELVPGERVVWRVLDAQLTFAEDPTEWTGTEITFDVARKGEQTEVRFAHLGLVPEFECFDSCSNAWGFFVNGSLRRLITTGEGPTAPPWA